MRRRRNRRGYTLQELVIVAMVAGLVATITTVGFVRHRQQAEDTRMQGELMSIYKAMEAYRAVYGQYPRNYSQLQPFVSIPNFDRRYEISSQ